MHTYCIQLRGQVDVNDLNPMCPHQMTLVQAEPSSTLLSIFTDQAGMVGMMGHLHNLGLTILSVWREVERMEVRNEDDQDEAVTA
jgi:hypothetical protein